MSALESMQPLRAEAEAALRGSEPEVPDLTGLSPFTIGPHPFVLADGVRVAFNASGPSQPSFLLCQHGTSN